MAVVELEHHEGGIAVLWLNRPNRRNALDQDLFFGIRDAVVGLLDEPPRVLVLAGRNDFFSSGLDLKPDNPLAMRMGAVVFGKDEAGARALVEELQGCFRPLLDLGCPTLAAIEGAAIGGALELALHCDMRVASQAARFSLPEVGVGLLADLGGAALLPRVIGPGRAAWLAMTAETIDAETASSWGLVEEIVAPGTVVERALELAATIAKNSPHALAATARSIRNTAGVDEALAADAARGAAVVLSGDAKEGMQAFMEKRAPKW